MGVDNLVAEKLRFRHLPSFSYKTLPKDSLPTKPLVELIYAQDNTAITVVLAMTIFVSKLARPAVLASYDLMKF